jgi:hypothetical protein
MSNCIVAPGLCPMRALPRWLCFALALAASTAALVAELPAAPVAAPFQGQAADGASVVPETDPRPERAPKLVGSVMAQHPRLLFGPEDVGRLRQLYESDAGRPLREQLEAYLGSSKAPRRPGFLRDATDGQRQGLWRLPTVALHYVLTGSERSRKRAIEFLRFLLELPDWETGKERNSGMSAANIMIGAALAYDWLHAALEPELREPLRQKLLWHARAMYHGGHLNKNKANAYWQGDPQNNHRWHRNAGMTLCALAAYSGAKSEEWILSKCFEDLAYVAKWLPEDGTSHEGPSYMIFGGSHLLLGMQASDRCFGTRYLEQPFFANVGRFMLHSLRPGREAMFDFGDSGGGGYGAYSVFLFRTAALHRQSEVQGALLEAWRRKPGTFAVTAWLALLGFDPQLESSEPDQWAKRAYFPDLGLAYLRDGWDKAHVGAMFKCGPFGGHELNRYRNAHGFKYINVAHDDPDANSFTLVRDGRYLAETDRYSRRKRSANHNTILVNGRGQVARGRPEGLGWTQPATGRTDMREMAYVTAYQETEQYVLIEGEAAGSYPGLERFRRSFLWVEGRYVLVLDEIRADSPAAITWLMQGKELQASGDAELGYELIRGDLRCAFIVRSTAKLSARIVDSSADARGKALGWSQLQLEAEARELRIASVYDLWGRGELALEMQESDEGSGLTELTVRCGGSSERWTWQPAPEARRAAVIRLIAVSRR